jgi:hypothetical protein
LQISVPKHPDLSLKLSVLVEAEESWFDLIEYVHKSAVEALKFGWHFGE